jgi:hypothetical protein
MRARTCTEIGVALALVLMPGLALAQDWTLDQLMRALGSREHAQAQFTETKTMRLLSRPLTLRGTLSFRAPDWLEKHTLDPNEEILRVDGERISVEIPVRRIQRSFTLQELPAVWGFVESIRATLRGDRAALERFYQVELEGEVRHWVLTLRPIDARMSTVVSEIRLSGAGGRLASIDVLEARGDRSVMKIREAQP